MLNHAEPASYWLIVQQVVFFFLTATALLGGDMYCVSTMQSTSV
jgi:hypothetical protein